jgi:crotonobetainyl-CoA:carnitine CoA-transferase CaiB-like acyl-CoA transferase
MGLGEAAVRAVRPDIIYVSIAGFGFEGPYAGKPVFDPLVQALSGLTTVQAGSDEARPRLVRTILPDKLTAIQTSQAVTAALLARERSGEGQHVRISMLDTVLAFLWSSDMGSHTFVGEEPQDETAQSFIDLIYETADGYISVAVIGDKTWAGLARAALRPEWLEDPRFKTPALREINKDDRLNLTQEALRERTTAEWLSRLEAQDVPCAPVLTRREAIRHPQVAVNGIVIGTEHPQAGRLRQARQPAQFSGTPLASPKGAPLLGQDTEAVLIEAGLTPEEVSALIAARIATRPPEDAP